MQEVWSLEGRMEAHSTSQWLRLGGICQRKFFLREKYLTWKYKKQLSSVILCEITSHRTVFHIFWKLYFPFRRICHCATYARGFGRWQRVFFWNASLPPCLFKHWWMGEADEKWQVLEIFFFYSFPPSLFLLSSEKSVFNQAVPAPGGRSWVFLFFFFLINCKLVTPSPILKVFIRLLSSCFSAPQLEIAAWSIAGSTRLSFLPAWRWFHLEISFLFSSFSLHYEYFRRICAKERGFLAEMLSSLFRTKRHHPVAYTLIVQRCSCLGGRLHAQYRQRYKSFLSMFQ